ncbi:MAG: addiction module protein [Verrucomicrobiota bacterium]|nr:addiction module protein [Verrucomicrobiota bacterium]
MSAREILEQIERLPLEERHEVAEKVFEKYGDFDDELTPEQAAELDRRLAEFEKNPREGIPWEQVEADLNKRFGWR